MKQHSPQVCPLRNNHIGTTISHYGIVEILQTTTRKASPLRAFLIQHLDSKNATTPHQSLHVTMASSLCLRCGHDPLQTSYNTPTSVIHQLRNNQIPTTATEYASINAAIERGKGAVAELQVKIELYDKMIAEVRAQLEAQNMTISQHESLMAPARRLPWRYCQKLWR